MLVWLFYIPLALLVYQFVLFPLALYVLSRRRAEPEYAELSDDELPTVAFIIAARNEEDIIADKIDNSLSLRYPSDKIRFIVIANGCTDRTTEIVGNYKDDRVELIEYGEIGKTEAQNRAVKDIDEDILVFSDANTPYAEDAVYELVKPFQDQQVGSVAGNHIYMSGEDSRSSTEGFFWNRIELLYKKTESVTGGALGAMGSIYAVRRELYIPLPPDIVSDFWEPVLIAARGKRTVFMESAICYEAAENPDLIIEFQRKSRIVHRACYSLVHYRWILNPLRYPRLAWLIVSHKLMRWLTPFMLAIPLMAASMRMVIGRGRWPQVCYFVAMSLFGFFALLGRGFGRTTSVPVLTPAYYASLMFYAAAKGVYTSFAGDQLSTWDRAR
ncbi:MAG TPA: glycosyltransferase [Bacteroidetes bacterium]|nr:beta-monoglucosyldiacylglycerol synthase [bacterium BMS3Bbin04]HDO66357.1 glycosyltransferase [Bacteroidota bacterium]HEX05482.1 glycosyltransferase [Bacteroidota bacterium]